MPKAAGGVRQGELQTMQCIEAGIVHSQDRISVGFDLHGGFSGFIGEFESQIRVHSGGEYMQVRADGIAAQGINAKCFDIVLAKAMSSFVRQSEGDGIVAVAGSPWLVDMDERLGWKARFFKSKAFGIDGPFALMDEKRWVRRA